MSTEGGFDLSAILQQAQAMQEQMLAAQEAQAAQTITGTAGGGKVTVQATGGGLFERITISPDVVDPDDVELLEELVLAAVRDAANQIAELQTSAMRDIAMPDLNSLPNLGAGGGLAGLFGNDS